MTNAQRLKSDIATIDKRVMADKAILDNRVKNDEMTIERRSKADKTMDENRLRNDELTADRRELKDRNPSRDIAVFLLILAALTAAFVFVLI